MDNFNLEGKLLYDLGKLCIPTNERIHVIKEAHTCLVSGHFGVGGTLCHLQRLCYWPHMKNFMTRYVKGCMLCSFRNPTNRKLGLYTPLPVSIRPQESVSMDFVGSFPLSRRCHDYLYVIVDRFRKMCVLVPCKMQITTKQTTHLLFQFVWVHFGLPTFILSNQDSHFLRDFWTSLWRMMDTKLKKSTTFHLQSDGQTEVVNHTVIHLL